MPPSPMTGTPRPRPLSGLVDRGDLRHADARHHAGRADRPRPDPDFDRVGPRFHQRLRALLGGDVAGDHVDRGPSS